VSSPLESILGSALGGGGFGSLLGGGSGRGSAGGGMLGALAPALIGMLAGGGLNKIMSGFSSAGMEDKTKSWVSNDPNKSLSPEEVKQVVDHEQIAQVAQKAGISHDEAAGVIAQALPAIVNHLTPDGQLPDPATAEQKLSQMHTIAN
jgi:uncharacterized protein YidB (DUF937 family)